MKKKILFMASGRGSNFRAIVEALQTGQIANAESAGLIVDRKDTKAAMFARQSKIDVFEIDYASYTDKAGFNEDLLLRTKSINPDLIVTAGFMRILKSDFVNSFSGNIINIHPSLLPAFPGMRAQKQAVEYGVKIAGATVHFVDEGVDSGPIILQAAVAVQPEDTEETLASKILEREHEIIVEAVQLFCADRLQIQGRSVRIKPSKSEK